MNLSQCVKVAQEKSATLLLKDFGLAIAFILLVVFVLRLTMKWMVKLTPKGGQLKDVFLYVVVLGFMSSPRMTGIFNIFLLFGPFILGLVVPDGPPLGSALVEKLDPVVSGLFLPLFASTYGIRIDLSYLKESISLALPLSCKMPVRDSLALAFIMITKGIVEMGLYSFLNDNMDTFAFVSIIIVLLASIVPVLVKSLYDPSRKYVGYHKRSIMHSKLNEEL
ncbi:hypothetical protein QQP08_026195 [Theobroma cacao]|nr:hypothetical protein QQP08_026195 [Theobroma cacao]